MSNTRSDAAAFHSHSHDGSPIGFTGERVIPDEPGWEWCFQAHLFGYEDLLTRISPDAKVLDIGAGEGYGANALSQKAANVVACDYSYEAVAHAKAKYADNIRWVVCDAQALPFAPKAFDVVASLQVIEHFVDTDSHLSSVAKILKPEGFHYCATPNIALATPEEADNEFHVRDFDAPQLAEAMNKHFSDVELLGQFYDESSEAVARMRDAEDSKASKKLERIEALVDRLPGPLRVRSRNLLRAILGVPKLDANTARNMIKASDFRSRPPAEDSFCLIAIARRPRR